MTLSFNFISPLTYDIFHPKLNSTTRLIVHRIGAISLQNSPHLDSIVHTDWNKITSKSDKHRNIFKTKQTEAAKLHMLGNVFCCHLNQLNLSANKKETKVHLNWLAHITMWNGSIYNAYYTRLSDNYKIYSYQETMLIFFLFFLNSSLNFKEGREI